MVEKLQATGTSTSPGAAPASGRYSQVGNHNRPNPPEGPHEVSSPLVEQVVYFVGAGLSAPIGLPVMSNFLMRSRDQYFSNRERFSSFSAVFDRIARMAVAKNYFRSDLFNIEEILSILEMESLLTDENLSAEFLQYIKDVINYHTPEVPEPKLPGNWHDYVFQGTYRDIGIFVGSLLRLKVLKVKGGSREGSFSATQHDTGFEYNVVSLNYDLVLENCSDHFKRHWNSSTELSRTTKDRRDGNPILIKLHGSVDGEIVPPTWSKSLNPSIALEWREAYRILGSANHIRIIGYSLPITDAYIQYLLKAAVLESTNLKSIDILCLDHDKSVLSRYRDLIHFPYTRFASADSAAYFKACKQITGDGTASFLNLEPAHNQFFKERSVWLS